MKTQNRIATMIGVLVLFMFGSSAALGQSKDELQKRSAERYPQLLEARRAGEIGETSDGLIEAVKGKSLDADLGKVVDAENGDRRALYKILAEETSSNEQIVARRAGRRNIDKAAAGEWVKADGKWEQKQ
jgi:uncharacterized protein YdbL (DUF1318 family)